MTLEPTQKSQLESWIEQVREHEHSALQWAALLYRIKESGYWKSVADTWPDFCYEEFGYSRDKAYRYVACGEALEENKGEFEKNPPKSINQVQRRKKVARLQLQKLEYVGTETANEDKPMATARKLPGGEIEHTTPPPVPAAEPVRALKPLPVPDPIRRRIDEIVREGMRLPYTDPAFRHFMSQLLSLQKSIQLELPGMAEAFPCKNAAKGSRQEVVDYCVSIGLPASDGQWFYDKMEGAAKNGRWQNGGRAVADYQATIRAWRIAGYMASQKQSQRNGTPADKPKHWASKELDRDLELLRKGGNDR